jgi:hypothetical protein
VTAAKKTSKALVASDQDDAKLAAKIVAAIEALDAADVTREERAIAAGRLLAEAQKRHPQQAGIRKIP